MRRALALAAWLAALAPAAWAQATDDQIDAALRGAVLANDDEDAAEARSGPAAPSGLPAPRVFVPAPQDAPPQPPMRIDEPGRGPGQPVTPQELNYEARIRSSRLAAQGQQGPLDGSWTMRSADGRALYAFQLVDRGDGVWPVEGVWRDLSRAGAPMASGFVDSIDRYGMALTIRFTPKPDRPVIEARLEPSVGGWTGRLTGEGAPSQVVLRRD